jgi:predicted RNA-binding protein with RPS1 domain
VDFNIEEKKISLSIKAIEANEETHSEEEADSEEN